MEGFGLIPQIEHYGCMVDLLGRAGCLEEVEKLIESMPYDANGIILSSFLFACGHSEDVTRANKRRWSDAEEIKRLMRKNQANKEVGCSVIEVDGRIKEFVAGDRPCMGFIEKGIWNLDAARYLHKMRIPVTTAEGCPKPTVGPKLRSRYLTWTD
ncbi:pentatricopeptide repeat-containing protein [Prunus yedoensis var. nudiflora]|uniref:Pentatricopeptide repeat-containing protein n=1 Tax=Prunus yedoensis var. nudiflora TaxID=2094558 RepID=A0A314YU08_PRUYE|nr:pentatricopeptide repeat-containing protein [Prunus yedoensis var. nudiflora]